MKKKELQRFASQLFFLFCLALHQANVKLLAYFQSFQRLKVFVTKTIAIFNQAGGVGKTTLTHNLGYQIARRDRRVLLVDMDPQSSLTKFVGLVPSELAKTVANAIIEEEALPIHKDLLGMDFVPANRFLSATEMQLVSASLRDFRLKDALELVQEQYDYILLDCPPSLGLLSYISLVAATHVLVPVETHLKAFEGTDELLQTLTYVKSKPNKQLQVIGFVPTRYDGRNSADIRTLEAMNEQLSAWGKVFEAIPRATAFVDASEERLPLAALQAKHPAVKIMNKIIDHIEKLA